MGPDQAPTRAAVLELRADRVVVEEAYDFLDEKRLLLAAELLRQLADYQALLATLETLNRQARQDLSDALKRHGLQGLSVYPVTPPALTLTHNERNLMGVSLYETELTITAVASADDLLPSNPSLEADRCAQTFRRLLELSARLAGVTGNLHRLFLEYRSTERRARALENVILPDIENGLKRMSAYLDEMDLEDAIRARPLAR
jgi:V/A-type H+-transporting ATPase subunit D